MHGRRISRTLWEYFKVTNVIPPSPTSFNLFGANVGQLLAQDGSLISGKESAFSMLRLKNISKQKDIFSSLESLGEEQDGNDSDLSEPHTSDSEDEEEDVVDGKGEGQKRRKKRNHKRTEEAESKLDIVRRGGPGGIRDTLTSIKRRSIPRSMEIVGKNIAPPMTSSRGNSRQNYYDSDDDFDDRFYRISLAAKATRKIHYHRSSEDTNSTLLSVRGVSSSNSLGSILRNGLDPPEKNPPPVSSPQLSALRKWVGGGGGIAISSPKRERKFPGVVGPSLKVSAKTMEILPASPTQTPKKMLASAQAAAVLAGVMSAPDEEEEESTKKTSSGKKKRKKSKKRKNRSKKSDISGEDEVVSFQQQHQQNSTAENRMSSLSSGAGNHVTIHSEGD